MPHTAQDFQIRLREDDTNKLMESIEFYLTDQHMIFRHEPKPDNVHFHIYIFGLYRNADAIRERFKSLGYAKERYAVSVTAGKKKERIKPDLAYQYALNPLSKPTVIQIKGFTDEDLEKFKAQTERYYNPPIIAHPSDGVLPEVIFKQDRVWIGLRDNLDLYRNLTVKAIKSKISAKWLNDGKAIPRPSDLHRYALSLYYLAKHEGPIPDTALMDGGAFD